MTAPARMRSTGWRLALVALLAAAGGPAMAGAEESNRGSSFERDRAAILAMAGTYRVSFRFRETVPLRSGYEPKEPQTSGGAELVEIIEDSGDRIVLQHLLVTGGRGDRRVVKHWRQAWEYEKRMLYEYRGDRIWAPRRLSQEEAEGTWTQSVFQVDDSPRYAGVGAWAHTANLSAWASGETWRPLPRRERHRRDEYDVLVGRNRHTLTPSGWVHEQDNRKLVLEGGEPGEILVREVGLNCYRRAEELDLSAAREYWQRTAPFWRDVRGAWAELYQKGEPIRLKERVDGRTLWRHMFSYAKGIESRGAYDREAAEAFIDQTLARFLVREQE